jgi:hypothetical protein
MIDKEWTPVKLIPPEPGLYLCKDIQGREFPAIYSTNPFGELKWVSQFQLNPSPIYYKKIRPDNIEI